MRDLEQLGHLPRLDAREIVHEKDFAEIVVQCLDATAQHGAHIPDLQFAHGILNGFGGLFEVRGEASFARAPGEPVVCLVAGNPQQPRTEFRGLMERIEGVIGRQEGLLGDVLGLDEIPGARPPDGMDRGQIPPHQGCIGLAFARQDPFDQVRIVVFQGKQHS